MSRLEIRQADGGSVVAVYSDYATIAAQLHQLGVRFERWRTAQPLAATATQDEVLAAYHDSIARLTRDYDFQSVDVVSLRPDHPQKAEMRSKFLAEHVHSDFEVRFFVEGSGLFYLHVGDSIYLVLCEQGDLISVPANTPHWFDMGENPHFKCIRLFTVADGWQAQFTGSGIAEHFPSYDQFVAAA